MVVDVECRVVQFDAGRYYRVIVPTAERVYSVTLPEYAPVTDIVWHIMNALNAGRVLNQECNIITSVSRAQGLEYVV